MDLHDFVSFAVDIVCMLPPTAELGGLPIHPSLPFWVCQFAVGLLVVSVLRASAPRVAAPSGLLLAVTVCLCVLSFGFLRGDFRSVFVVAYPPMMFAIRTGEGALIGATLRRAFKWWHAPLFAFTTGMLYLVTQIVPSPGVIVGKAVWALAGTAWASLSLSIRLGSPDIHPDSKAVQQNPLLAGALARVALFLIFASTLLYIGSTRLESLAYDCTFPIGMAIGFIFHRGIASDGTDTN